MARGAVRLVGAVGVVGAAVAAHVAAGGQMPSPALLLILVLALTGLAALADRLPAQVRSVRIRLAAAVVLQPVLHCLFDRAGGHVGTSAAMPVAHLAAAALAVWWSARGARRLVAALAAAGGRLVSPGPVILAAASQGPCPAARVPAFVPALHLGTVPRRGPPTTSACS